MKEGIGGKREEEWDWVPTSFTQVYANDLSALTCRFIYAYMDVATILSVRGQIAKSFFWIVYQTSGLVDVPRWWIYIPILNPPGSAAIESRKEL